MNEYVENRFEVKLDDGIIHYTCYEEHVDYASVDDAIKKRLEIINDFHYPILSDITRVKSNSREARERMSRKDAGVGVSAVAILVNSKVQRIMYNFFHSIYKAPAPAKLFTNKDKAIEWLQQFKK